MSTSANGVLTVALSEQEKGFAPYRLDNCTGLKLHLRSARTTLSCVGTDHAFRVIELVTLYREVVSELSISRRSTLLAALGACFVFVSVCMAVRYLQRHHNFQQAGSILPCQVCAHAIRHTCYDVRQLRLIQLSRSMYITDL